MLVRSGVGGASLRVGGASAGVPFSRGTVPLGYGSSQRFSSADAVCERERHEAFSCVEVRPPFPRSLNVSSFIRTIPEPR
ncbi:unnamed protein product [Arctogadus glacialis]